MITEQFFTEVFEALPTPTVILRGNFPDIIIAEANPAYVSLTGRTKEEVVGKPYFQFTSHPSMQLEAIGYSDVHQSIIKVLSDKIPVKTPVQKFTRCIPGTDSFEILYFEAINTPLLDENNDIRCIIRSLQNVTDLVLTQEKELEKEAQLIKNEKLLREAQHIAGIGTWEIDRDNKVRWSEIHYEILERVPGQEITLEQANKFLKDDKDRKVFWNAFSKSMATGDYFDVELEVITLKGNHRWLRFTGQGEIEDGEFIRMYGTSQNITEKKRTEQELLHSRNQLEALIQTLDGIVWEADAQTLELSFLSHQVENITGYTVAECLSKPGFWRDCMYSVGKEAVINFGLEKIQAGQSFSYDYRIIKKDGTTAWVKASTSVINEDGKPKWLRGLIIDITASKRLEQLEQLEKSVLQLNAKPGEPITNVLKTYLQGLEYIFPQMHCSIMQVKNGHLFNWMSISLPKAYEDAIENLAIGNNVGSCGTAAFLKQKVIVNDIATDPRWEKYKTYALQYNLQACWSYPIINASGEVMATLGMYYSAIKDPGEDELNVIERTAAILKEILENRQNAELLEVSNLLMTQSEELAHFGSVYVDLEKEEIIWSEEFYSILGIDKSVIPTRDLFFQAIHPEDRPWVTQQIQDSLDHKTDHGFEMRIVKPDGELRYLKTWGRIKTNESGHAVKIIAAHIDITEIKKIQEELITSEARLRSIVDSETNYVIRTDLKGRYTYINKKYLEDFATKGEDNLLGKDPMVTVLPYHRQQVLDISYKCIAHPNEVFQVEMDKYDSKGRVLSSFWHFVCLTDAKGQSSEIQCIGIDITDKKLAEEETRKKAEELAISEKRYSDLFQLSPQPMWVFEMDTLQFLDVNEAAIQQYGFSREEFLSMTIADIRPPEEVSKLLNSRSKLKSDAPSNRGIYFHRKKSGEIIHVDIQCKNIPFKGGLANLVLASDITYRVKYLSALEDQNKRLGEIAWIQSHVVRAPLARILGMIDIIKNYSDCEEEKAELLGHIADAANELDVVIRDITNKTAQVKLNESYTEELKKLNHMNDTTSSS